MKRQKHGEAQWSVGARRLGAMPATVLRLFLRRFEWRSGDRYNHEKGLQEQAVLQLAVSANRSIVTIDLGRTNKSDLHGKPLSRSKSFQKCRPCLPTTVFGWTYLHPLTLMCRLPTRYGQGSNRRVRENESRSMPCAAGTRHYCCGGRGTSDLLSRASQVV